MISRAVLRAREAPVGIEPTNRGFAAPRGRNATHDSFKRRLGDTKETGCQSLASWRPRPTGAQRLEIAFPARTQLIFG